MPDGLSPCVEPFGAGCAASTKDWMRAPLARCLGRPAPPGPDGAAPRRLFLANECTFSPTAPDCIKLIVNVEVIDAMHNED